MKKELARGNLQGPKSRTNSTQAPPTFQAHKDDETHFDFWLRSLSEFHKAQCFYSIALEIASFVTIYGKDKNRTDEMFLLLISADGIVPVAIALYTLLFLRHAQIYDVFLAGVSVLLASVTGFCIILGYSSTTNMSGTRRPASCGRLSPEHICDLSIDFEFGGYPNLFFKGGAIVLDVLVGSMILGYCLSRLKMLDNPKLLEHSRIVSKRARTFVISAFQFITTLSLLACTAIELWFFRIVLHADNIFVSYDWSFGQIVGITIWSAFIVDLIRYELCTW